jgi:hypothetical protein
MIARVSAAVTSMTLAAVDKWPACAEPVRNSVCGA